MVKPAYQLKCVKSNQSCLGRGGGGRAEQAHTLRPFYSIPQMTFTRSRGRNLIVAFESMAPLKGIKAYFITQCS